MTYVSPINTPYYKESHVTLFMQAGKETTRHQIYQTLLEDGLVSMGDIILKKSKANAAVFYRHPEDMQPLEANEINAIKNFINQPSTSVIKKDNSGTDLWDGPSYYYLPATLSEQRQIRIQNTGLLDPYMLQAVRALAILFPQIKNIKIFGSRAKGKAHRSSDYDLSVETDDDLDPTTWRHITDQIQIADKMTKVDCVHYNKIPAGLRGEIDREDKLLYVR